MLFNSAILESRWMESHQGKPFTGCKCIACGRRLFATRNASTTRTSARTHPLVKCALFVYEFVTIHPFQDGNGRLSRLLSTLLLLKYGYTWIQYVSFEHEIEHQKTAYYRELRRCQSQRPGEDVTSWVHFFLAALRNIQMQLTIKEDR